MNVALDKQHGSTKMWIKLKSARGWDKHKNKIVYVPKYLYLGCFSDCFKKWDLIVYMVVLPSHKNMPKAAVLG